jgi:hypothetical protein
MYLRMEGGAREGLERREGEAESRKQKAGTAGVQGAGG